LVIDCFIFFFFQAEDGIRDKLVTGVQTCALPIFLIGAGEAAVAAVRGDPLRAVEVGVSVVLQAGVEAVGRGGALADSVELQRGRSEERRVGKECRSRWWAGQ